MFVFALKQGPVRQSFILKRLELSESKSQDHVEDFMIFIFETETQKTGLKLWTETIELVETEIVSETTSKLLNSFLVNFDEICQESKFCFLKKEFLNFDDTPQSNSWSILDKLEFTD